MNSAIPQVTPSSAASTESSPLASTTRSAPFATYAIRWPVGSGRGATTASPGGRGRAGRGGAPRVGGGRVTCLGGPQVDPEQPAGQREHGERAGRIGRVGADA